MAYVASSSPQAGQMGNSILIVEDEALSRRALAYLLSLNGYEIEAVGSAEEALELIVGGRSPTVALIDVDLPGLSGLDLVRRLAVSHPTILPVLITATDRERVDAFRNSHPVPYMRKPIDVDGLLALLSQGEPAHQ